MIKWLENHPGLAAWIQAIGVIVAMGFGVEQLRQAQKSLQASVLTNEIALRANASDLLVDINQAALADPSLAGEYVGQKRLHLMRLHYFYRTYQLRRESILNDDEFAAESDYLAWCGTLEDFTLVWETMKTQYPTYFRAWVDEVLQPK